MTLSDFANLATVLSGIAVLASLIYLAQQTRQNTKHTRAMIEQSRNKQIAEGELLYVSDPQVRDIIIRGDDGDPSLTPTQIRAYIHFVSSQLVLFEDLFYQHRSGLLEEERHASTILALKNTRANRPGFRAAWKICKVGLGMDFQTFVDQIIAETQPRPLPDMSAVWQHLLAAERPTDSGA